MTGTFGQKISGLEGDPRPLRGRGWMNVVLLYKATSMPEFWYIKYVYNVYQRPFESKNVLKHFANF